MPKGDQLDAFGGPDQPVPAGPVYPENAGTVRKYPEGAGFVRGSPTSKAARPSLGRLWSLRALVLAFLEEQGAAGATDDELDQAFPNSGTPPRCRRVELVRLGKVMASGRTRPTRHGHQATVWVAVLPAEEGEL